METLPQTLRFVSSSVVARLASAGLGAWLLVSAFLWPHESGERFNAVMVGLCVMMWEPVALYAPAMRWLDTVAAVYLMVAALWFEHASTFNLFHHLAIGGALFVLSMIHGRRPSETQDDEAAPKVS